VSSPILREGKGVVDTPKIKGKWRCRLATSWEKEAGQHFQLKKKRGGGWYWGEGKKEVRTVPPWGLGEHLSTVEGGSLTTVSRFRTEKTRSRPPTVKGVATQTLFEKGKKKKRKRENKPDIESSGDEGGNSRGSWEVKKKGGCWFL